MSLETHARARILSCLFVLFIAAFLLSGATPAFAQADLVDGGSANRGIYAADTQRTVGQYIRFWGRILNQGSGWAAPFRVAVYLSTDTTITTHDRFMGTFQMEEIVGGGSRNFNLSSGIPVPENTPPGTYYLGWIINHNGTSYGAAIESNYANNQVAMTTPTITVLNSPPRRPTLSSPASGATGQSLTPTLSASAFSDPNGDSHASSVWQVSTDGGFITIVYTADTSANLTSIQVPSGKLISSTLYYWRVRYRDSRGALSEWATTRSFRTGTSDGGGGSGATQLFDSIQPVVGHTVNRWAFMTAWNLTSGAFFQSSSWRNGVLTWEHNAWEYNAWIARFVYDQASMQTRSLAWYYRQVHVQ